MAAATAFQRDSRDGDGALFSTISSPDDHAAQADHLHLDLATSGTSGFNLCR